MFKKLKPYIISVVIALLVGGLSALLTRSGMDTYSQAVQPKLAPPPVVFPIVWTILFILMGISSALVFVNREKNPDAARSGLFAYGLNLSVNFTWSIIFFNMQAYLFAFIWLLLLLAVIISMTVKFAEVSKLAAYLQFPYILWVTFAGYLTFMVFLLN